MQKETHYLSDSGFRLIVADTGHVELVEPATVGRKPDSLDLGLNDLPELADLFPFAAKGVAA